jgi:hypothetical protein
MWTEIKDVPNKRAGENLQAKDELLNLLRYNGLQFCENGDSLGFVFAENNMRWEVFCKCAGHVVIIYGVYPFKAADKPRALEAINEINTVLAHGSVFLKNERIVLRTSADLIDQASGVSSNILKKK